MNFKKGGWIIPRASNGRSSKNRSKCSKYFSRQSVGNSFERLASATQKQPYLERQIRASKRMEAAAINPRDIDTAKQRIRAYQSKLRDHIKQHDLPRRRHPEEIKQYKGKQA